MDTETSESSPIPVYWLEVPVAGQVGMTFAPGTYDGSSLLAAERSLEADLRRIRRHFKADVLVTLMEEEALSWHGIADLPRLAQELGLRWRHYPIQDYSVPISVEATVALLDEIAGWAKAGDRVVIHCRGGLGRTGTIAASYLVRLGIEPEEALRIVARQRQSSMCPENDRQKDFVRGIPPR